MKILDIQEAKSLIPDHDYAYLQLMSEHILDRTENIPDVKWDELVEAYYFNKDDQIHIYRDDDELKAVLTGDIEGANIFERRYELSGRYKSLGDTVVIYEYLKGDEDGQCYVAGTRLVGIE